jgi:hypothetical protein
LNRVLGHPQYGDELNREVHDHPSQSGSGACEDDFDADLRLLEERLGVPLKDGDTMKQLTRLMSPTQHHTSSGMLATRIFAALFDVV